MSQTIQRIQRNVRDYLRPNLLRFVNEASQMHKHKLIPLNVHDHRICTVPQHADLEQIIVDLRNQIDDHQRYIASMKQDNRRLQRRLVKKSMKIDALDLAASSKRSQMITDAENIEVDMIRLSMEYMRLNSLG
jgi:hypothetical protein